MSLPDLINCGFEALGGIAVAMSCLAVLKHKKVHGVSLITVAFFTSWGLWNLYFYPKTGQYLSGLAAIGVCLANLTWCCLILKYRNNR